MFLPRFRTTYHDLHLANITQIDTCLFYHFPFYPEPQASSPTPLYPSTTSSLSKILLTSRTLPTTRIQEARRHVIFLELQIIRSFRAIADLVNVSYDRDREFLAAVHTGRCVDAVARRGETIHDFVVPSPAIGFECLPADGAFVLLGGRARGGAGHLQ